MKSQKLLKLNMLKRTDILARILRGAIFIFMLLLRAPYYIAAVEFETIWSASVVL